MLLYLVRHGKAEEGAIDYARKLSPAGARQIRALSGKLKEKNMQPARVFHSGLVRAEETAHLLAEGLGLKAPIESSTGLRPMDDVEFWMERLKRFREGDLMLVGHNPYMENLALELADEEVLFKTGGIVCLSNDKQGQWKVLWTFRQKAT